jgi:DNA polymerase I-like protein with 3'-5' exonuclease and polymerase domains
MTKALDKFEACVTETGDNLLYAQLNQTITATHRLSSTGRNYSTQFQNLHRIFKPLFSPRYEGWKLGEADEAQLEYRVAVFLGQDEAGMHDIANNVDAHAFTASFTHAKEWDEVKDDLKSEVRKAIRTDAKADTFKPLYGGSSGTPAQQEYYKAFKEKHQGITQMQEDWKNTVLRTKKLRTVTGLEFYWPDTKLSRSGYITNSTNICNYPVQMFATADIVPIAVVYQWHYMKAAGMHSFLVNTVHDSSISEVHPEENELFENIVVQCFTDKVVWYLDEVYNIDFNISLEAEIELDDFWADSEGWRNEFLEE